MPTFFRIWIGVTLLSCLAGCSPSPPLPVIASATQKEQTANGITESASTDHLLSTDWHRFLGPNGDSTISSLDGMEQIFPTNPQIVWRTAAGHGYSSPVISSDRLILFDRVENEEIVHCLAAATGAEIWRHSYTTAFTNQFEYSDGPPSTPLVHDGMVFTLGAEGMLHCLDLNSGDVVWSKDLAHLANHGPRPFGYGSSPVVLNGQLIVNAGSESSGAIMAFQPTTGEMLWATGDGDASYATPTLAEIDGRRFIVALTNSELIVIDAESGDLLDSTPYRSRVNDSETATSPVVVGNRLIVTTHGLGSTCFEISPAGELKELWNHRRGLDVLFNTMTWDDSSLIGFSARRKNLMAVTLEDGETKWELELTDFRGSQIRCGTRLLILGEEGRLYVVQLNKSSATLAYESAEPILEAPCYSSIAFSNGLFFMRNETEILACTFAEQE